MALEPGDPGDELENLLRGDRRRRTELRAAIDRVAINAARAAAKETARQVTKHTGRGYVALLLVLFIGAQVYNHVQEARLHNGLTAACNRVNALRIHEANRNAQVLYAAFYNARQREQRLARGGGPDADTHRRSVEYITASIDALRWTPRTDCEQAVDHATSYQPPAPRPFSEKYLDLREVPQ